MIVIYSRYNRYRKKIVEGENLYRACICWNADRHDEDDLWWAFQKSKYYIDLDEDESNFDERIEAFETFMNSLTGEQLFEIMRDGNNHFWIDTEAKDDEDEI